MGKEHEQGHREFLDVVEGQQAECSALMEEVSQALGHLNDLRSKYVSVSTKTNALHEACEHLLTEQVVN